MFYTLVAITSFTLDAVERPGAVLVLAEVGGETFAAAGDRPGRDALEAALREDQIERRSRRTPISNRSEADTRGAERILRVGFRWRNDDRFTIFVRRLTFLVRRRVVLLRLSHHHRGGGIAILLVLVVETEVRQLQAGVFHRGGGIGRRRRRGGTVLLHDDDPTDFRIFGRDIDRRRERHHVPVDDSDHLLLDHVRRLVDPLLRLEVRGGDVDAGGLADLGEPLLQHRHARVLLHDLRREQVRPEEHPDDEGDDPDREERVDAPLRRGRRRGGVLVRRVGRFVTAVAVLQVLVVRPLLEVVVVMRRVQRSRLVVVLLRLDRSGDDRLLDARLLRVLLGLVLADRFDELLPDLLGLFLEGLEFGTLGGVHLGDLVRCHDLLRVLDELLEELADLGLVERRHRDGAGLLVLGHLAVLVRVLEDLLDLVGEADADQDERLEQVVHDVGGDRRRVGGELAVLFGLLLVVLRGRHGTVPPWDGVVEHGLLLVVPGPPRLSPRPYYLPGKRLPR